MWEKQECGRERGNENILHMRSGTATIQASGDLDTRCSEIPGRGAQPLSKENHFFATHVRLCVVLLLYIYRLRDEVSRKAPVCLSSEFLQGFGSSAERKV